MLRILRKLRFLFVKSPDDKAIYFFKIKIGPAALKKCDRILVQK